MLDPVHRAVIMAMEHGGPETVWRVAEGAEIRYGQGRNPFEGMTITHWSED